MDELPEKSRTSGSDKLPLPASSSGDLATYISNLNKLRDIYIDGSLFRNPAWDVFLTLYTKRQEGLRVTLAALCAGNRLTEADCSKAIEALDAAGLVAFQDSHTGRGPQAVELTDQGLQRMDAFLRSAERA